MKQDDRSVMTSAVRRLGQEISKLGLRMRNRSPSGSESDVFCSTDELAAKSTSDGQAEKTLSDDKLFENEGASASYETLQPARPRRHSRNELDEDVEFKERRSSIKAALRPVLSRKSRSDLAKYSRPNQNLNLKPETVRRNGSQNSLKESVKENSVDGIRIDKNGKGEGHEPEISSSTYRVATKSHAAEQAEKKIKPRRPRLPKRSKSFSGLLNWRGAKQANKETSESDRSKTVDIECPRRAIHRSNSFSGKVEKNQQSKVDHSNPRTLQMQAFLVPNMNETNKTNIVKLSPEIFVTASNGDECTNGTGSSGARLSFMALKGFRYEEGMIETDLCSTEL